MVVVVVVVDVVSCQVLVGSAKVLALSLLQKAAWSVPLSFSGGTAATRIAAAPPQFRTNRSGGRGGPRGRLGLQGLAGVIWLLVVAL